MRTIAKIKLSDIHTNPNNIFTDNDSASEEQIRLIAESINMIGLESPLVVYNNAINGGKEYILLSGHKRYKALKLAGKSGLFEVPCVVEEKPKDIVAEREILLQNNISRKSPEELQRQCQEASVIWNIMDPGKREQYKEAFKNQFIIDERRKGNNVTDQYIHDNFRPRLEYIKRMTGLSVTNRTVTNFLKREVDNSPEAFPKGEAKKREITIGDIIKRINSLSGMIAVYQSANENLSTIELNSLQNMISALEDAKDAASNLLD